MSEISNVFITSQAEANDKGLRLDKFLAQNISELSRAQLQRLINLGFVSCDDNIIADNSFKVRIDDCYQVFVLRN